jgi:hypothetical protein
LAHCEKQEDQATDNQDDKRVVCTPSRPKISEKPDPKRTSGARVAFSTSSQPIFAAEPQAVPA